MIMRKLLLAIILSTVLVACEKDDVGSSSTSISGGNGVTNNTDPFVDDIVLTFTLSDSVANPGDIISIEGSKPISSDVVEVYFDDEKVETFNFSGGEFQVTVPKEPISKITIKSDTVEYTHAFHQYRAFCNMMDSLEISDMIVTHIEEGEVHFDFNITNKSSLYLDMKYHNTDEERSGFVFQSYMSDNSDGSAKVAAGGTFRSIQNLTPGETITASFDANDKDMSYAVFELYYVHLDRSTLPLTEICVGGEDVRAQLIAKVNR